MDRAVKVKIKKRMLQCSWTLYAFLLFSAQVYATTITISGTLYSDEGMTPITSADQTIHLIIDGVSIGTDVIDTSGNYSITATITPANPYYLPLLVYVDNGTVNGTTVTQMDSVLSTTLANFDLYADHLIIRQDGSTAPLDTGDMHNAKGAFSDPDILYNITWPDTIITGTNTTLYIANGYAYEPAGNVTTHHIKIEGTLNAGNNTFNVSGNWDFTNGDFNYDTSTVNFTGTGSIINDNTIWWNKSFYHVNASYSGETTTIYPGSGIVVRALFTLGSGTLSGGNVILTQTGTPFVTAGATLSNNQFKYSPNDIQVNITAANYPNLWLAAHNIDTSYTLLGEVTCDTLYLSANSSGETSTLDTNGQNLTCNNVSIGRATNDKKGKLLLNNSTLTVNETVTINNASVGINELDANNGTIYVGQNWNNQGKFTAGTSSVIFNGTSPQSLTTSGDAFYDLTIDNTGGINNNGVVLNEALTVNNTLTINNGKINTTSNNYSINVTGNFNQSSPTSEMQVNSSVITVHGDFTADGTINSLQYNNASLVLTGTSRLTYNSLAQPWYNGFNNLTVGQSGNTTTQNSRMTVRNVLTVGSGAFTSPTNHIYLLGANPLVFDVNATLSLLEIRFFGSNQSISPLNNGYDCHIWVSRNNTIVTQTGPITLNNGQSLRLNGDKFANRSVTYQTNGFDLNIGGDLQLGQGADTALKTLDISNSTVTVKGDIDIRTGTNALIATTSNLILNGTAAQTVTTNGKTFDALTLTNASTSGVTFNDSLTTNTLTNTTPNAKMTFASGQTYTVNNGVTLQGATGQPITLAPSSAGTTWDFVLNAGATKTIENVTVSWSDASGSDSSQKPIAPSNSIDGGDNIDWFSDVEISVTKNSILISDPINGTGGGKNHIPGAIVEYRITARNTGTGSPDANAVIVYDILNANVEYDVTTGVSFLDGTTSSGLSLGSVRYSHISTPDQYTYTPTGTFDPNVAKLKIETSGTFATGGTPPPEFTVTFRVRIQ